MDDYCFPEKGKAALLTISAQRDFGRPDSPICARGIDRALPAMVRLVESFRRQSVPIFHSIRLYRPDGSNVEPCRRTAVEEGLRIFMPGSFGAELIDALKPDPEVRLDPEVLLAGDVQDIGPNEFVFYRPRWGAFHNTPLEAELKSRGITTVVICGFSFSTGTRATVYEASARDFRIVVVPDAICSGSDAAMAELGRLGVYLMQSDSCCPWIAGARPGPVAA
jgi:nicotinamidase-related amidase